MLYLRGDSPRSNDAFPIFVELIDSPEKPTERIALTYNGTVVLELCRFTGIIFRKPLTEGSDLVSHIKTERGRNNNLYLKIE